VPSLQRAIEAGWAKGFDRRGAAEVGGRLAADACIGATEVLVALWHLRVRASGVEITRARDSGKAVYQLAAALFSSSFSSVTDGLGWRCGELPIFLQAQGRSWLIVGVTSQLQKAVLLLDPDLLGREEPSIEARSIQSLNGRQYQLVICQGQCDEMSTHELMALNGQGSSGEELRPAATFGERGWEYSTMHEWLRNAMALDLPTSFV